MKVSSPLRYPGGKSKLAKTILKHIPKDIKEYREPFLGGGSVLFEILADPQTYRNIQTYRASDTFSDLHNFWTIAKNHNQELVKYVKEQKNEYKNNGRALHQLCRDILLTNNRFYSNIEKAGAFYILNRCSFSGLTLSGGYSQASFDTRFCDSHIKKLSACETPLKQVEIYDNSYEYLLNLSGEDVWIYLDPPYDINSKTLYGINGKLHSSFDHKAFAKHCKNCKHKLLVSYNDNEYIKNLFSWANIKERPFTYNLNSKNKKATELFIMNY